MTIHQSRVPDTAVGVARASYAQDRLWFLEQLAGPEAATYNVGLGLRFEGPLSVGALEFALSRLVERHESLRTTLEMRDDGAVQVIHRPSPVRLRVEDVSDVPDPEAAVAERADREQRSSFDIGTGPVLRTALLRLGTDRHVLLIVLDHIACDAWSLRVLHRDLLRLYRAELAGRPLDAEEPIQYADFAEWQRDWLDSGEETRQLDYWRRQLAEPLDRVRLGESNHGRLAGGSARMSLAPQLLARLAAVGRRSDASLFMVLGSAFTALLAHRGGTRDVVFGSLLANRNRSEVEDLIGFLANTAVIRVRLPRQATVEQALAGCRDAFFDAFAHQDVPFHRVVEALRPPRAESGMPYFDVMLQYADVDRPRVVLDGLVVEPLALNSQPAPVDLVVTLLKEDGGHSLVWDFSGGRVGEDLVAELQAEFAHLLELFATGTGLLPAAEAAATGPVPDAEPGSSGATPLPVERQSVTGPAGDAPVDEAVLQWQRSVAQAWGDVLGYPPEQLSAGDDFFELGGHSLAAGRVAARLSRLDCGEVPLRLLFDCTVLSELAVALAYRTPMEGIPR